jgi:biopolymer transport protein ExbB/TolQ
VLGILAAFHSIDQAGQTGAKVVVGPIGEALSSTALGLGVAIPAVIAYNYFSGRVNAMGLVVEDHALELAARLPMVGIGTVAGTAERGAA